MSDEDSEEQRLLNFIGELYDAAADPPLWRSIAVELARLFQSESCLLLTADTKGGGSQFLGVTENIQGKVWQEYEKYYYAHDQWIAGGLRHPGQAVLGHAIAPEEWFRKSEFLNELAVRAGVYDLVGSAIPLGGTTAGIVGIHRPKHAAEFDTHDARRLDILIPHLRRAMQLTLRLMGARIDYQAALDGLERTGTAIVVVDAGGGILFASNLAEMLLRQGGSLKVVNGHLAGADHRVAQRLACLVRNATGPPTTQARQAGAVAIERPDGRPPITVLVTPFRPVGPGLGAPVPTAPVSTALVLIRDPEVPTMATDILRDLFGLTPAQAAVAARIAEGEDLEHIAAALHISLYTVRDHLKVIFGKTNTQRQSQLAALLAPTVAALRDVGQTADPPRKRA